MWASPVADSSSDVGKNQCHWTGLVPNKAQGMQWMPLTKLHVGSKDSWNKEQLHTNLLDLLPIVEQIFPLCEISTTTDPMERLEDVSPNMVLWSVNWPLNILLYPFVTFLGHAEPWFPLWTRISPNKLKNSLPKAYSIPALSAWSLRPNPPNLKFLWFHIPFPLTHGAIGGAKTKLPRHDGR